MVAGVSDATTLAIWVLIVVGVIVVVLILCIFSYMEGEDKRAAQQLPRLQKDFQTLETDLRALRADFQRYVEHK